MLIFKHIIVTTLILILYFPALAGKRPAPIPIQELTDPDSPAFVPIPYPKNRQEVITDLLFILKRSAQQLLQPDLDGTIPQIEIIGRDLVYSPDLYHFGEIFKVKNGNENSRYEYYWIILVMNKEGKIAARWSIDAAGLGKSAIATSESAATIAKFPSYKSKQKESHFYIKKPHVLKKLSKALQTTIDDNQIEKIEELSLPTPYSYSCFPLWKIVLKNGKTYVYSTYIEKMFEVYKTVSWKIQPNGHRQNWQELTTDMEFICDGLNDEIMLIKEIEL